MPLDQIRVLLARHLKLPFSWSPPIPVDSLGERLMSVDRLVLHRPNQALPLADDDGRDDGRRPRPRRTGTSPVDTGFVWTRATSRVRVEVTVPRVASDTHSVTHAVNLSVRDVVGMVNLSRFCVTFRLANVNPSLRGDSQSEASGASATESPSQSVSQGAATAKYITTCVVENATRHIWWKVRCLAIRTACSLCARHLPCCRL